MDGETLIPVRFIKEVTSTDFFVWSQSFIWIIVWNQDKNIPMCCVYTMFSVLMRVCNKNFMSSTFDGTKFMKL